MVIGMPHHLRLGRRDVDGDSDPFLLHEQPDLHVREECMKTQMSESEIDDLADDALNAACLTIQKAIGQTDGGPASIFFSEDEVKEGLKKYIRFELEAAKNE